ncbi:hypothetical protein MSAN_01917100 [Mycena sanguinolenta]|uniref:Uncharacterized protein n=1 Tax=Mycena sanguinolenta TaxID=230812 RepID=A0A8H6XQ02_9AGAR|nr:hypothetical protein MSAN_01917100 [Mycena sanguinolenta]
MSSSDATTPPSSLTPEDPTDPPRRLRRRRRHIRIPSVVLHRLPGVNVTDITLPNARSIILPSSLDADADHGTAERGDQHVPCEGHGTGVSEGFEVRVVSRFFVFRCVVEWRVSMASSFYRGAVREVISRPPVSTLFVSSSFGRFFGELWRL